MSKVSNSLVAKAKKVSEYTNKAIDTIYNKTIDPVVDKIASIDFAGSYFSNPHIPDYQKFAALNRSFVKNDSAVFGITGRPTPPLPQKEIKMNYWKYIGLGLAAAVTFGAVGYAVQNKHLDNVNNDISSGIAYAELQATGAASSFTDFLNSITNQAPVANIKIDTSPDKMIAGEKIVFNASGSYDPDGKIKEYKWYIFGPNKEVETKVTQTPLLKKAFSDVDIQGEIPAHIVLNVKDDKGKVAAAGIDVKLKTKSLYQKEQFLKTFSEPIEYNGIKIIGDEEFQKDVVMSLEFAKKYSPVDYQFIKENTKEIEASNSGVMSAADGHTSINKSYIREEIEEKAIRTSIAEIKHESWHNYADINDPKNNTEELAYENGGNAWDNLSYVSQSEIDKFYREFNFSKFKN